MVRTLPELDSCYLVILGSALRLSASVIDARTEKGHVQGGISWDEAVRRSPYRRSEIYTLKSNSSSGR